LDVGSVAALGIWADVSHRHVTAGAAGGASSLTRHFSATPRAIQATMNTQGLVVHHMDTQRRNIETTHACASPWGETKTQTQKGSFSLDNGMIGNHIAMTLTNFCGIVNKLSGSADTDFSSNMLKRGGQPEPRDIFHVKPYLRLTCTLGPDFYVTLPSSRPCRGCRIAIIRVPEVERRKFEENTYVQTFLAISRFCAWIRRHNYQHFSISLSNNKNDQKWRRTSPRKFSTRFPAERLQDTNDPSHMHSGAAKDVKLVGFTFHGDAGSKIQNLSRCRHLHPTMNPLSPRQPALTSGIVSS
jgi:hypothetical protein